VKKLVVILLPILVLAIASALAFVTVSNRQPAERRSPPSNLTEVDVTTLEPQSYSVRAKTRGTVRPRTESTLIPEVSGRVLSLSPNIREGEFFEAGDLLLEIDPRDYHTEVTVARATLAQTQMSLAEEDARARQARRDWQRLGEKGEPDSLVLREPQLAGARAAVASAEARLAQAALNLERTRITAPYAGRVLERNVDVGQYVTPGNVLVRVYAVDYVEIRLPLTNRQLEFVDVPEIYRGDDPETHPPGPVVTLRARIGSKTHEWSGRIVRAEGSIDTRSRQLFVVAQVDDPYGKGPPGRPPLKVGQFVEAEIEGRTLENVFVVPRAAVRTGGEVLLLDSDNRIESKAVNVLWASTSDVVIGAGLQAGNRLVLTPLGSAAEGLEVAPRDLAQPEPGDTALTNKLSPRTSFGNRGNTS